MVTGPATKFSNTFLLSGTRPSSTCVAKTKGSAETPAATRIALRPHDSPTETVQVIRRHLFDRIDEAAAEHVIEE